MSEQLLYPPYELLRSSVQVPQGAVRRALPVSGRVPERESPFDANIAARLKLDTPPVVDIERAEALAEVVNERYGPEVCINLADTIHDRDWVRERREIGMRSLQVVANWYIRGNARGLIDLSTIDSKRALSQAMAEFLVNRAMVAPITTSDHSEPSRYFNVFEFAQLRKEFNDKHMVPGLFYGILASTAVRKRVTRDVLASAYDAKGEWLFGSAVYATYRELADRG